MSQKKPEIYLGLKGFRTIFEKRTTAYSLGAPLLGLAKSIYYYYWALGSNPIYNSSNGGPLGKMSLVLM